MTNENIVERLRDIADSALKDGLAGVALTCQQAADEIEYLRQRCEEIDQEWRQTIDGQKEPYGRRF